MVGDRRCFSRRMENAGYVSDRIRNFRTVCMSIMTTKLARSVNYFAKRATLDWALLVIAKSS